MGTEATRVSAERALGRPRSAHESESERRRARREEDEVPSELVQLLGEPYLGGDACELADLPEVRHLDRQGAQRAQEKRRAFCGGHEQAGGRLFENVSGGNDEGFQGGRDEAPQEVLNVL